MWERVTQLVAPYVCAADKHDPALRYSGSRTSSYCVRCGVVLWDPARPGYRPPEVVLPLPVRYLLREVKERR